jgi:hypothetical protein
MLTLLKRIIYQLLWDELAAVRWLRGLLHFLAILGVQLVAAGEPAIRAWSLRDWCWRAAVAGIGLLGGMVTAGDKTPQAVKDLAKTPEAQAAVEANKP